MSGGLHLHRRLSAALVDELGRGGALAGLAACARRDPELLQILPGPGRKGVRAAELSMAGEVLLRVEERRAAFRLEAHPAVTLEPALSGWMTRGRLAAVAPDVDAAVVRALGAEAFADAVSDPAARALGALVAPGSPVGLRAMAQAVALPPKGRAAVARADRIAAPVRTALARGAGDQRWWPHPRRTTTRLSRAGFVADVLAADVTGRLHVLVVPGRRRDVAAAPVAARHGAEVLAHLLHAAADEVDRLDRLLVDLSYLGLVEPGGGLARPAAVVPVVVLSGGTAGPGPLARAASVAAALAGTPSSLASVADLEVWVVDRRGGLVSADRPGARAAGVRPWAEADPFQAAARAAALAWKATTPTLPEPARAPAPFRGRGPDLDLCLPAEHCRLNLLPEVRRATPPGVDPADTSPHLLDTTVQVLNAVGPVAASAEGVGSLFAPVVPVGRVLLFGATHGRAGGAEGHAAFGWRPGGDGGADGAVSADVAFRYVTPSGEVEGALVAWFYAERSTVPDPVPRPVRERFRSAWDDPGGPFRTDLADADDLLGTPLRRILLLEAEAWRAEQATELGAARWNVVVARPAANEALWMVPDRLARRSPAAASARDLLSLLDRLQRDPGRVLLFDTGTLVVGASPTTADFRHRYGHMAPPRPGERPWTAVEDVATRRAAAESRLAAAVGLARATFGPAPAGTALHSVERAAADLDGRATSELERLAARLEELVELARSVGPG